MSDKAFKVTAAAIGALVIAVVVRGLMTPSTVDVQTGARVVCSQCGAVIVNSVSTVQVAAKEVGRYKVTETKAVCQRCAARSPQAAAQRALPAPELVGPPRQPATPAREGAARNGDRLPTIRYREDIQAQETARAERERQRRLEAERQQQGAAERERRLNADRQKQVEAQQQPEGNRLPRPSNAHLLAWINRDLRRQGVRDWTAVRICEVEKNDSLDYPLSVRSEIRFSDGSDPLLVTARVNPRTGAVNPDSIGEGIKAEMRERTLLFSATLGAAGTAAAVEGLSAGSAN